MQPVEGHRQSVAFSSNSQQLPASS
uniref:Uncharacterized protein n=1 Tax=Macrostomum lignano TaxID=282301 RepID=A0A1I8F817_9PLAT